MTLNKYAGIQKNALVLPSSIFITSRKIKTEQEEGFSFAVPEGKQKELRETFSEVCEELHGRFPEKK